jgi:hypothetical protein
MFGTQPMTHSSGTSLAYGMPFRTWDTYKAREFDNTMVYFQWSTKMDLAHWETFRWTQGDPAVGQEHRHPHFARVYSERASSGTRRHERQRHADRNRSPRART